MAAKIKRTEIREEKGFKKKGAQDEKRPYSVPVLIRYGELAHLTAGGSGPDIEPGSGVPPNKLRT